jgi:hypothetical protein
MSVSIFTVTCDRDLYTLTIKIKPNVNKITFLGVNEEFITSYVNNFVSVIKILRLKCDAQSAQAITVDTSIIVQNSCSTKKLKSCFNKQTILN